MQGARLTQTLQPKGICNICKIRKTGRNIHNIRKIHKTRNIRKICNKDFVLMGHRILHMNSQNICLSYGFYIGIGHIEVRP